MRSFLKYKQGFGVHRVKVKENDESARERCQRVWVREVNSKRRNEEDEREMESEYLCMHTNLIFRGKCV